MDVDNEVDNINRNQISTATTTTMTEIPLNNNNNNNSNEGSANYMRPPQSTPPPLPGVSGSSSFLHETNSDPPASELPSYNEALRLKKLEANESQVPPTYYPSSINNNHSADFLSSISIDTADVNLIFFIFQNKETILV
jgi:hypothetical protein